MKKIISLAAFLLLASASLSAYEYIINNNSTWLPTQPGTQITALTGGNWDDGYFDLALPAGIPYYFYGKKVTHIRIWTNGYVTFGFGSAPTDGAAPANHPLPYSLTPNAYIAPWWDDWDLTSRGQIWYQLWSNAINIEWQDIPHYYDLTASYDFRMGIRFSAEPVFPNEILFYYLDVDSGTGTYDRGASGTIGIEHYTGSQGERISYNQQLIQNTMKIRITPFVPVYDSTDWNSAGSAVDFCVFRPSEGIWYRRYDDGSTWAQSWGTLFDVPVPGDYDGNGSADVCVVRPSNYLWYGTSPTFTVQWGMEGDIPVPSDYNNDGITDIAVFRPSYGLWLIYYRTLGTYDTFQWGAPGDIPVPGDYDHDGRADCAVYRPSDGLWYIRKSSNPASPFILPWGTDGDVPMCATADPTTYFFDVVVYRPSQGMFYRKNPSTGSSSSFKWGIESDYPIAADWNRDEYTDWVVFRPAEGLWYISSGPTTVAWGAAGDKPRMRWKHNLVAPPGGTGVRH